MLIIFSVSGEVMAALNEALPAASTDIERELDTTERLAWRYTALLETVSDTELNRDLLTQVLYNLRQHQAFLKIILVRRKNFIVYQYKL